MLHNIVQSREATCIMLHNIVQSRETTCIMLHNIVQSRETTCIMLDNLVRSREATCIMLSNMMQVAVRVRIKFSEIRGFRKGNLDGWRKNRQKMVMNCPCLSQSLHIPDQNDDALCFVVKNIGEYRVDVKPSKPKSVSIKAVSSKRDAALQSICIKNNGSISSCLPMMTHGATIHGIR